MQNTDLLNKISGSISAIQKDLLQESESRIQEQKSHERRYEKLCLNVIELLDFVELLKDNDQNIGLEKVAKRFASILKTNSIQVIDAKTVVPGQVKVIETHFLPGEVDGKILEVCKKGYQIGAKTLRPAEVISNRLNEN